MKYCSTSLANERTHHRHWFARRQGWPGLITTGLVAALSIPASSIAQPSPTLIGSLDETFSRDVQANAVQSVVGLMLLPSAEAKVDLTRLQTILPQWSKPTKTCFSATTSDGFYLASGTLQTPVPPKPPPERAGAVAIQPASAWKYVDKVGEYPGQQFAGLLISGMSNCNARPKDNAVLHPIRLGEHASILQIAIASRGAEVAATLTPDPPSRTASPLPGDCRKLTGRAAAFDVTCRFDVDQALLQARTLKLVVKTAPVNAPPRSERFNVQLAP